MARFRGTVLGARGEASRLGHRGIHTVANGWNVGVEVIGAGQPEGDEFRIVMTGGSNNRAFPVTLGFVRLDENGVPRFFSGERS